MWVYRLGLSKAEYYALTGESISGKDAAAMELINFSYPLEELDDRVSTPDQQPRKRSELP